MPQSDVATILLALINQLPAIIAALTAMGALIVGIRNGRKADLTNAEVRVAASNAEAAATKAEATHDTAQAIASQSEVIAAQTNGHISRMSEEIRALMERNAGLEKTVTTLVSIITAERVARANAENKESITVPAVRESDLTQAMDTIAQMKPANGVTPDPDPREPSS